MSFTVLSDANVRDILTRLSPSDISSLLLVFSKALRSYSVGQESLYQCHRQGISRPGGPTMLFMPASLPGGYSVKVVGVPPPRSYSSPDSHGSEAKPIQGAIMIFDDDGRAIGVINAAETTAFRTSLGSILLYQHRHCTENILVFGAGKQALWHLRLALVLRSSSIQRVTIVNRAAARAEALIARLLDMDRLAGVDTTTNIEFQVLESIPGSQEGQGQLRKAVEQADVIFCTTPSTEPLFPATWLTSELGRQKTRFISAIGSYKLDMQEIDPIYLRTIASPSTIPQLSGLYHHKHATTTNGGVIIVDSREACAAEAGELVKAGVSEDNLLEIGELNGLQEVVSGENGVDREASWLKTGLVIYKSVGLGVMDLAIGGALIELSSSRSVGLTMDDF